MSLHNLNFERFEYKYFVPEAWCDRIRRFIAPYTEPDREAGTADTYTITNLYFDTPHLAFYQAHRNGALDRFKLRVRSYGERGDGDVFFEVKRKTKQVVRKNRARVPRDVWEPVLRGDYRLPLEGAAGRNLEDFLGRALRFDILPTLLIRYEREAYGSAFGDYARLTLDRAIRWQEPRGLDLEGDETAWSCVDSPFATNGVREGVLLELKFTSVVPAWMCALVRTFELERCQFSKYLTAIEHRHGTLMDEGNLERWSTLGVSGERLLRPVDAARARRDVADRAPVHDSLVRSL